MPIQSQELLSSFPAAEEIKCALFAEIVSQYGTGRFKALGSSMIPSIWPGDTLLVEGAELVHMLPGDIAVYLREGRLFAHRVVRHAEAPAAALITRGDAMTCEDPPVHVHELLGRVVAVEPGPRERKYFPRALARIRSAAARLWCKSRGATLLQQ
ncbi:MAG TPA: S24/S26 family peptidase [Terriglobales bacterium]|nr:S24/S26 family peptidase [Terriglobales bacterium]